MLSLDKPAVGLFVAFLENPLCGDFPAQRVCGTTLAGYDHLHDSTNFVAESIQLANSVWKIGQVLEDVDRNNTIKKIIREVEAPLAVCH